MKKVALAIASALLLTGCSLAAPEDEKSNDWKTSYFDCLSNSETNGQQEELGLEEMEKRCSAFADKYEGKTTLEVIDEQ